MIDYRDGGMASRKLWTAYLGMILIALGGAAAVAFPGFQVSYTTFVGGIVALFSVYCGASISHSYVAGNVNGKYFQKATVDSINPTQESAESQEKAGDSSGLEDG